MAAWRMATLRPVTTSPRKIGQTRDGHGEANKQYRRWARHIDEPDAELRCSPRKERPPLVIKDDGCCTWQPLAAE